LLHTHTQRWRRDATGCGAARCQLPGFVKASQAIEPEVQSLAVAPCRAGPAGARTQVDETRRSEQKQKQTAQAKARQAKSPNFLRPSSHAQR
jgi:hypothetical protein